VPVDRENVSEPPQHGSTFTVSLSMSEVASRQQFETVACLSLMSTLHRDGCDKVGRLQYSKLHGALEGIVLNSFTKG
jgi:hypothetical protein